MDRELDRFWVANLSSPKGKLFQREALSLRTAATEQSAMEGLARKKRNADRMILEEMQRAQDASLTSQWAKNQAEQTMQQAEGRVQVAVQARKEAQARNKQAEDALNRVQAALKAKQKELEVLKKRLGKVGISSAKEMNIGTLGSIYMPLSPMNTPTKSTRPAISSVNASIIGSAAFDQLYSPASSRSLVTPETTNSRKNYGTLSTSPQAKPTSSGEGVEAKIQAAFKQFDTDGDGAISQSEMEQYFLSVFLGNPGSAMRSIAQLEKLAKITAKQAFCEADTNHDGKLVYEEFKNWFSGRTRPKKSVSPTNSKQTWV